MFEFEFAGEVFRWQGKSAWHFLALPEDLSAEINRFCHGLKGGWGSIPVRVRIGSSAWSTSIFPDRRRGTYILPLKAEIRRAEGIGDGAMVDVSLSI